MSGARRGSVLKVNPENYLLDSGHAERDIFDPRFKPGTGGCWVQNSC
jgi:hypothetical protein